MATGTISLHVHSFHYLQPETVEEALTALAERAPEARILAGGTDLIVQMTAGRLQPDTLIYSGRIAGMQRIEEAPDGDLTIGAGVTLRQVELHAGVRRNYPALAQGSREVGSVQIRNLATLAGNLCNASPSADTSPPLLAYGAEVEIAGTGTGRRRLPIGHFWTGPGRTALGTGEMVTAIHLPAPPRGQRSFYFKLAVRKAMDLAMVGVTVTAWNLNGSSDVRIALGAVAPVCVRATEAEDRIRAGGHAAISEAAAAAVEAASPIDDQRASSRYRREMIRVLTERGLRQVLQEDARTS